MSPPDGVPRTRAEMLEAGRALRARVPRRNHGQWTASPDRPDPLEILSRSNANRLPELVPVRNGRMMASPFAFYRGSPAVMAADLSRTPSTGIMLQICGDAHLLNFGTFATPERSQVFDLNDFDETQPGPWEWDVMRLAASLVVAARTAALSDADGRTAVKAARRSIATRWRRWRSFPRSRCGTPVWTSSRSSPPLPTSRPAPVSKRPRPRHASAPASERCPSSRRSRWPPGDRGGSPVVVRLTDAQLEQARTLREGLSGHPRSRPRTLAGSLRVVDAALKVVGVGSVGTRCFVVLLAGKADLDPLFLQVKEARPSVLAPYVGRSRYANQGKRVVVGQRIMQAASDVFLGLGPRRRIRHHYVRSATRHEGVGSRSKTPAPTACSSMGVSAAPHWRARMPRAGQPALLAGYMGKSSAFDDSLGPGSRWHTPTRTTGIRRPSGRHPIRSSAS